MTYSVEKLMDGERANRWGFFDTIEAAKESAGNLYAEGGSAAVWEGESTSAGAGVLVSVFDRERGWIDVEQVAQPAWWDSVSTEVRAWLTANPGAPLPSRVWVPVVQAGGAGVLDPVGGFRPVWDVAHPGERRVGEVSARCRLSGNARPRRSRRNQGRAFPDRIGAAHARAR